MSSAGYHFGARSEGSGIVRNSPFFEPPIFLILGEAEDILARKKKELLVTKGAAREMLSKRPAATSSASSHINNITLNK